MTTYYFFSLFLLPFMHGAIVSCIFINLLSHGSFHYSNIKFFIYLVQRFPTLCESLQFNMIHLFKSYFQWLYHILSLFMFQKFAFFCVKTLKVLQWTWKHVWFKHSTTFCICLVKSYLTLNQLLQLDLISILKFSFKYGDQICHNFHALKIHVLKFWSIIIPRKHI
jgi:hypothetical protein